MKLARVLSMRWDELADRGRQQLAKRLERVGGSGRARDLGRSVFDRLAPVLAPISERARAGDCPGAARSLLERFIDQSPARFFEGASDPRTPELASRAPGAREETLRRAGGARRGRFDLLGYRGLFFGDPVSWDFDPVSGGRAPFVHWSLIDPLDAARVGDHKVIWELNRHQWLVSLGQAYRLTGDERYAEAFGRHIRAWMDANPPGWGINWTSSLEVALRLIAWCWSLMLLRESPALSPSLFADALGCVWAHARYVERYLSGYFSPNTHLTGEALGLFYAGTVFPELGAAPRWRALGQRILETESERQILPDGVHFELATCYQRYTVEIYLHFLILAARNGVAVDPVLAGRLERLLDFLLAVRRPDGSLPQIGDADGGSLLPLAGRRPDDVRGVFATAAAFFGRADYAWAAGGRAPEIAWLLGASGVRAFDALRPEPPAVAGSRLFREAGYVVMRSGWGEADHQLVFDAGPLGCPVSGGHGHADLLSIQCSLWGEPYLVDSGTYTYRSDSPWRDFFRGTLAHSTVVVDGESQAVPAGPFSWSARPRARLLGWSSTEAVDVADAVHEAYGRLASPVRHRRQVLWVKPRFWVLVDDLEGSAEHEVQARFQFAPLDVTLEAAPWARARDSRGHGLLVCSFTSAAPLRAEVRAGRRAPIEGWVSADYGQREAAPMLTYTVTTRLPLRIATLLWPVHDGNEPAPDVATVLDERSELIGLSVGDGPETIAFDEVTRWT